MTYTIDNDRTFTDLEEAADYMAHIIWENDEYEMTGFERDMLCLDICGTLEYPARRHLSKALR